MKKIFTVFLVVLSLLLSKELVSQTVFEHISNNAIYSFLDEMANEKYIEINDVIKPYGRKYIFKKLSEIDKKLQNGEITLNKRQKKELFFYLESYFLESEQINYNKNKYSLNLNNKKTLSLKMNPPGLFYKDSLFAFALQPILGASYSTNSNGVLTHTWGFASMFGYLGKHLAFYTNVRDNDLNRVMNEPDFFVKTRGVPFKNGGNVDGVQYSEAMGGFVYSSKWITLGLIKDHPQWGTGYNGTNIQSGHAPSFAQIIFKMHPVRWFELNYYHGWLTSDVVDSSRSYWSGDTYRVVYFQKYIAANMFTFYPFKNLNFSFGNSIVYTNESGGGPIAAFFIPFLFYKSVDITLSSYEKYGYASNNNQLFINISSRNIKHLHLYFSLFADDISVRYFYDKNLYNSFSYKLGFRLSDFYLQNLFVTGEYTMTNPYVYQHHTKTQDYTSNSYIMGHYLRDNSREFYLSVEYKPIRGLSLKGSFMLAQHGDDYDINDPDAKVHSDPILENIIWQNRQYRVSCKYEIVYNTYVFLDFNYQNITGNQQAIEKYTPEYYRGKTNTFTFGANIGF